MGGMTFQLPNKYEDVAHDALREACLPNGARVFSKVRMGDVFPLTNANVPAELLGYVLRSHFDFLVTTGDRQPLFSVDFDRPPHRTSNAQTARDRLKDRLCQNFGHPLLRIGSDYVTKTYRGLDLLTYFVEAWFLGEAFDDAQQQGLIPYDEPFDITYVYSAGARSGTTWPYWLSLDIQNTFRELHEAGSIGQMVPSHVVGADTEGNHHCLSWLVLDAGHVIEARTGMRVQQFPAVDESDLVSMLAMFDILPKVKSALRGERAQLLDREEFFASSLPAFQKRYEIHSSLSVGPTI